MRRFLVLIGLVEILCTSCTHRGIYGGCKHPDRVHGTINEANKTGHL